MCIRDRHAVGLVKHEMSGAGEVERAQLQMRDEAARGGNDHISARAQAFSFLLIARTVVAAVDGHTVDVHIIRCV